MDTQSVVEERGKDKQLGHETTKHSSDCSELLVALRKCDWVDIFIYYVCIVQSIMIRKFPSTTPNLFIGIPKRLDTRSKENIGIPTLTFHHPIDDFFPCRIDPWFFDGRVGIAKDRLRGMLADISHKMEQSPAQRALLDVDNQSNVANAYHLFQFQGLRAHGRDVRGCAQNWSPLAALAQRFGSWRGSVAGGTC